LLRPWRSQKRAPVEQYEQWVIEALAYQQLAIKEMERREVSGRAMHPIKDKRARPHVAVPDIKDGALKSLAGI